jgi:hypothetical protein
VFYDDTSAWEVREAREARVRLAAKRFAAALHGLDGAKARDAPPWRLDQLEQATTDALASCVAVRHET